MSIKKINEYIQAELKKRELTEGLVALQERVYNEILMKKAKVTSLEFATKALEFADLENGEINSKIEELKKEIETSSQKLTVDLEAMIKEENKDSFVQIVKKTKFIKRVAIDYKFFENLREDNSHMIGEIINEELILLSPYKVSELVKSEKKFPAILKFVDLYTPETSDTGIDNWIDSYAKHKDDAQQIRVQFIEISNEGFFTNDMVKTIAIRWSIMLGLSGNMQIDKETKIPKDPEMQKAVEEVTEIIKQNAVIF